MKNLIEERKKLFREKFPSLYKLHNEKVDTKYAYLVENVIVEVDAFHAETTRLMVEEFKKQINEKKAWYSGDGNKPIRDALDDLLQSLTELL